MCRHLAYLGPPVPLARLLTEPPGGLYQQSWAPRRQRYGTVNADGFGIGWYPAADGAEPARYRRAVPIWADANLPDLARTISSGAVLAAVRSATAGTSQDAPAAAPFRSGGWLFSHNGAVRDWTGLPADTGTGTGLTAADLLGLEAHCDSALLWAMVHQRLRAGESAGEALATVTRRTADARPDARLNLLLTDGRVIAATRRGDTLWYRTGPGEVLVASEPDDDRDDWREVPEESLLLATPGRVSTTPLRAPAPRESPHPMNDHRFALDNRLPDGYLDRTLRADVTEGLTADPKILPPKWFYDARGSELFEEITRLPEYYPTRAEQEILEHRADEIAAATGADTLVELGSGSSSKTRLLLDALGGLGTLRHYAPRDVSPSALAEAGEALCRDYPGLRVAAAVTDFEADLALPDATGPRLVAFLGGTIGNLDAAQRAAFFAAVRAGLTGDGDAFLLGADLVKDPDVLVRAYDDSQGVTAAFNKNVLHVINRELDADFDPDAFEHRAVWNVPEERIEMWLRATVARTVKIPGVDLTVDFAAGRRCAPRSPSSSAVAGLLPSWPRRA